MQEELATSSAFGGPGGFIGLGSTPAMTAALEAIGIQRPTYIQSASIQAFREHAGHLLIADYAGSGKTLAYLIPILEHLRKQEVEHRSRFAQPNAPAAIIMAPTQELCSQVRQVAKALVSNGMPLSIKLMTGGARGKLATQRDALQGVTDIVIGTPGRLGHLFDAGLLKLDCCQAIVLDEVDVVLGEASQYREEVEPLLKRLPMYARALLVTASLPQNTWWDLQNHFIGIRPVLGPGLHRPAPGSLEQLIDCSGGEEISEDTAFQRKASAMLELLGKQSSVHTIVFCNKLETCRKVENFLKRSMSTKTVILPFHAAIEEGRRRNNLQLFLKRGEGLRVLVCTDRLSRGVDTDMVGHVILFDFPRDPSEYLRRAGRTARGTRGKGVVSLLVLGRQVMLAKRILASNEAGQPLHGIPPTL